MRWHDIKVACIHTAPLQTTHRYTLHKHTGYTVRDWSTIITGKHDGKNNSIII